MAVSLESYPEVWNRGSLGIPQLELVVSIPFVFWKRKLISLHLLPTWILKIAELNDLWPLQSSDTLNLSLVEQRALSQQFLRQVNFELASHTYGMLIRPPSCRILTENVDFLTRIRRLAARNAEDTAVKSRSKNNAYIYSRTAIRVLRFSVNGRP